MNKILFIFFSLPFIGFGQSINENYIKTTYYKKPNSQAEIDVTNPSNPVKVYQHTGPTGTQAEWQEIKVRGKFAYVTTEAGGGLQIFNLSTLPNVAGITTHSWTGDGAIAGQLTSIHSLHIDNNFVYLYGSKLFGGGAIVADLTNPWTPTYAGKYSVGTGNAPYVHDGYVRNDTLFASHIYKSS